MQYAVCGINGGVLCKLCAMNVQNIVFNHMQKPDQWKTMSNLAFGGLRAAQTQWNATACSTCRSVHIQSPHSVSAQSPLQHCTPNVSSSRTMLIIKYSNSFFKIIIIIIICHSTPKTGLGDISCLCLHYSHSTESMSTHTGHHLSSKSKHFLRGRLLWGSGLLGFASLFPGCQFILQQIWRQKKKCKLPGI